MTDETVESVSGTLRQMRTAVMAEDTMAEAGRKILLSDLVKMLDNEDGSRTGGDIEHVHDMRVATRRMRSALHLLENYYKSRAIRGYLQSLKVIAGGLGKVRDLDVLLAALGAYQRGLVEEEQIALQPVLDILEKRRTKARRKLNALLDSDLYQRFVADFADFVSQPGRGARPVDDMTIPYQVRHVLPTLVHDRLANVRAYDNVIEGADVHTLHALRIEFKRLRYIVAFFVDILGNSGADYIEALKAIQDHLGALNDAVVAQAQLRALSEDHELEHATMQALGVYISQQAQLQDDLQQEFPDVWTRFNTRTVQRKLSDSLLVLR